MVIHKKTDAQMRDYAKVKKTLEQYYRLKFLLETVRKPEFPKVEDNIPKSLIVQPKTKTKRRRQW